MTYLQRLCVFFFIIACEAYIRTTNKCSIPSRVSRSPSILTMQSESTAQKLGTAALSVALAFAPMSVITAAPDAAHAAKSGGRVGGRSSSSFKAAPRPQRAAAPRVTNNNYYSSGRGGGVMIMPPPVISPFGFGYSPFGGMGTGYALGAMSGGGNRAETYRMENELGREQASIEDLQKELDRSRAANDQLEKRLDALEQQK